MTQTFGNAQSASVPFDVWIFRDVVTRQQIVVIFCCCTFCLRLRNLLNCWSVVGSTVQYTLYIMLTQSVE